MKLTVGDIRFSESGYASATVGVGTGTFPFLLFSICKMDVSVSVVDGKEIKDYDEDLRNKAREIITRMYKEIVCGENDVGEQSAILTQAAHSISIQITRLREEKRPEDTEAPETNKKIINYHYPEGVVRVALSALL
ncbi:TPA: hypothetical protein JDD40_004298 [Salmonella enterica subsp. diarizonae]|nr:hypothetical protein [Salmonella enterica subsp. diarizonae]